MFSWIYSFFIPYLKDFVLVYKIIIKLVALFFILVEFSNMLKLFSNPIFENSYLPKGGWMGDHALYAQIENLFNMCMNKEVIMSYLLDSHYIFNWYHNWYFYICILIFVFSIYVWFKLQIVSISIGIYIFIHIYMIWLCLQYLYMLKHKLCLC